MMLIFRSAECKKYVVIETPIKILRESLRGQAVYNEDWSLCKQPLRGQGIKL
jgi:hypothetical protein